MGANSADAESQFVIPEEYRVSDDILEEIPNEDLMKMKALFEPEWPKRLMAYTVMHSQYLRKKAEPDFPVVVCAPKGNPNLGIICIWYLVPRHLEIGVYSPSLSTDTSALTDALVNTKRVDWSTKSAVLFSCVDLDVAPCIKLAIEKKGRKWLESHSVIAHMEKEKAKNLYKEVRNDENLKMETLGVEHADILNDLWLYRHDKSLSYFQMMLHRGAAKGILDDEGVLRGWGLVSVRGDLHAVQTREAWRRRGYGRLIIASLAQLLADDGREVFGCVAPDNEPSIKMFKGLGFDLIHTTTWIMVSMLHEDMPYEKLCVKH